MLSQPARRRIHLAGRGVFGEETLLPGRRYLALDTGATRADQLPATAILMEKTDF